MGGHFEIWKKLIMEKGGSGFKSRLGDLGTPVNTGVPINLNENRANIRAMAREAISHNNYKPATLYHGDSKEWYVEFYYQVPGTDSFKRFKERFGINRIRTQMGDATALVYGQECVRLLNANLKAGLNPFTDLKHKKAGLPALTLLAGIVAELCKDATHHGARGLKESFNRLKKHWPGDEEMDIANFTSDHAQQFMASIAKLSSKTVRETIGDAKRLWRHALQKKMVHVDPWEHLAMPKKQVADADVFEPFTDDELQKIDAHLRAKEQHHLLYLCYFILYAWARPVEITRLRVSDIDMQHRVIKFRASGTKNARAALVQIVEPLYNVLLEMKIENYEPNYFLFGSGRSMMPGPKQIGKDSLFQRWQLHVRKPLGIEKNMYALKHTGNIMYLRENIGRLDRTWQQMQNRHASLVQTEKYCRNLGVYFVDTSQVKFTSFQNPQKHLD